MKLVLTCVTTESKTPVAQRNREASEKYRKMRKYRSLAIGQGITDKAKIEEYAQKLYKELEDQQERKASKSSSYKVVLEESDHNVENESPRFQRRVPRISMIRRVSFPSGGTTRELADSSQVLLLLIL
jgi:hypothetical protein